MVKIAPSIASGPLTNMVSTLKNLEDAGADVIHFDVEDGNFVPEMNIGIKIIKELRPLTKLPFDVHLMVNNPEWLIPILADFGANSVSVHFEACPYPRRTLQLIIDHNLEAGLAFNPATPLPDLEFCLPPLSYILILTTDPEAENATFLPSILNKIRMGKSIRSLKNIQWVADGDISSNNAGDVVKAGADMLIIGRGIFKNNLIHENMVEIRNVCEPV